MRADASHANIIGMAFLWLVAANPIHCSHKANDRTRFQIHAHMLRAQYAEKHAIQTGVAPSFLGGIKDQMDKQTMKAKLRQLSEAMGHGREKIMHSYYGHFPKWNMTATHLVECLTVIERTREKIHITANIPDQYRQDIHLIIDQMELLALISRCVNSMSHGNAGQNDAVLNG